MANLLKKIDIEPLKNHLKTQNLQKIKENLEELAEEVQFLKNKVALMLEAEESESEVKDTLFKLRDVQNSLKNKATAWPKIVQNALINSELQAVTDNMIFTLQDIEQQLMQKYSYL